MDTRGKDLFTKLVKKIKNLEPFKFMRFGDGEWLMYFDTGRSSNEYDYNRHGAKNLRKCMDGDFYYGLQNFSKKNPRFDIPEREWVDGDAFHYASMDGRLAPLWDALKGKDICVVGPKFLEDLKLFEFKHIVIPERNCYRAKEETKKQLEETEADVFIFCAGYLSNILIYEVDKPIMIDLGSLLDLYAGHPHRTYQHNIDKETYANNLPTGQMDIK